MVLAARDEAKAERCMASIRGEYTAANVEFWQLDTASLDSIRNFSSKWNDTGRKIDILILNAGIAYAPTREETVDGFERQFATNYLGHFALTGLLLPHIKRENGARIVEVASLSHARTTLKLDDLQLKNSYTTMDAYSQSKLATLMFGLELDRRLLAAGLSLASIPAHPGVAATGIMHAGGQAGTFNQEFAKIASGFHAQPASQGALPILFAATSHDALRGTYYGPDGSGETEGYPAEAKIAKHALNQQDAESLWSISEKLTGVKYVF